MKKPVAIITARGGSKRIPHKNIKPFLGVPILKYSIDAALSSGIFEKVIISTDSSQIADVAKSFGAEVPFMRSAKNSDDYSTTSEVLLEVLQELKNKGDHFERFCCLYPTAPFISAKALKESFEKFASDSADFSFPVCRFSYPPQRGLSIKSYRISMVNIEHKNTRSQDLEPIYHDVGQFYWGKTASLFEHKSLMLGQILPYIIDDLQCQDIDTLTDWRLAELKYQLLKEEGLL